MLSTALSESSQSPRGVQTLPHATDYSTLHLLPSSSTRPPPRPLPVRSQLTSQLVTMHSKLQVYFQSQRLHFEASSSFSSQHFQVAHASPSLPRSQPLQFSSIWLASRLFSFHSPQFLPAPPFLVLMWLTLSLPESAFLEQRAVPSPQIPSASTL